MSAPVVAVCMPMARGPHPDTLRSLLGLRGEIGPFEFYDLVGFQVDIARNQITSAVLANPAVTHLMWIDDDMVFDPAAVKRLLDLDLPIVGGLCYGRRHPYMPILIYFTERGHSFRYDFPEDVIEVDATGAAFLLVKREVFAKVGQDPWRTQGVGEDISFCMRARAAGFPIKVDTREKIGHVAEVTMYGPSAMRNRDFIVNPYTPPEERRILNGQPEASIVIPTWNQKPDRLRVAVDSAIHQTIPVEIIIVDNGSDHCVWCGTPRSDSKFGTAEPRPGACNPACPGAPIHPHLRLHRIERNAGHPWEALNLGIRDMRTEWFVWLSSDDILYPNKVERQLHAMKSARAAASFHGYDILVHERMLAKNVVMPPLWNTVGEQRKALASGCWINGLTVMIHRDALADVRIVPDGPGDVQWFDESIIIAADWDLWNRIACDRFWLPIPEILATRRNYDTASERYSADAKMRAIWLSEDAKIRQRYGGEA